MIDGPGLRLGIFLGWCALAAAHAPHASAEPYLAARANTRCSSCHVNMTGGGERNAFGRLYSQRILARIPFDPAEKLPRLTGEIGNFLTIGSDLRFVDSTVVPKGREGPISNEFHTEEANLYLTAALWHDRLLLHLDERVAPGGSQNREAFMIFKGIPGDGWIKAGRFFPPFGTRLYDDSAFIRNITGFSFQTPDEGVEVGFEPGKYSIVGAVTNGAGGGSETDSSKQVSLYALRMVGTCRIGLSASNNVTAGTRTSVGGIFGTAQWGDFVFLAEGDLRYDRNDQGSNTQWIGYAEEHWEVTRGVTIRVSHEYLDPDRDVDTDARTRSGLGVDWFPVPSLELSARILYLHGPPQIPAVNGWSIHAGAHLFF